MDIDEPPVAGSMLVAVVFNQDYPTSEDAEYHPDAPPSLEANAEVAQIARDIDQELQGLGFRTVLLPVIDEIHSVVRRLVDLRVDAVFNLVESVNDDPSREPEFPQLLEAAGIPYTGNGPTPLKISHAKDTTKKLLLAHHLPTPAGAVIWSMEDLDILMPEPVRYPLFIKPARADGSIGIDQGSIVHDREAFRTRVAWLLDTIPGPVLAEAYLPGREINVAMFPNPFTGVQAATEVDFSACPDTLAPIVTYNCKWIEDSDEYAAVSKPLVRNLTPAQYRQVMRISRAAFLAVGGNGYGRVDIRLDAEGRPLIIDVNPNPSLDRTAGMAVAATSVGIDYAGLIGMIVNEALEAKGRHVSSSYFTARSRAVGCFTAAY